MHDDSSQSTGVNYARDLTIAVNVGEIVDYGSNAAIVLQQIRYHRADSKEEWNTQSAKDLARMTGFTSRQVRRALNQLVEKGVLERTQLRVSHGDSTYSYRERPGDQTVTGCDQTVTPGGYQTVTPLSIEVRPSLFDSADLPPVSVVTETDAGRKESAKERRKRECLVWYSTYPRKANRAKCFEWWEKHKPDMLQITALHGAVDNYVESMAMWEKQHGATFDRAMIMYPSTFLNGGYQDYIDGPTIDRWFAPKNDDDAYDYSDGW